MTILSGARPRAMSFPEAESYLRKRGAWPAIERIARDEGVQPRDIWTTKRDADTSAARRRAMAVLRWSSRWSYPHIGRIFGRDHTTVIAACRKYERELHAHHPSAP
jgi:chromosomal replication initiation ATPase DnaA